MEPYAVRPVWSSSTFLQYLGTVVGVAALAGLFGVLRGDHGSGGLLLASAVVLSLSAAGATATRRAGEPLTGGLFAVVAVVVWGVFVSALLDLIGVLPAPDESAFFNEGLAFGAIVVEAAVVAAAAVALRLFSFPLLVLPLAAAVWYAVMDLLEGVFGGGNTATALLALVVGGCFVLAALGSDAGGHSPYAFWLHVVGGLSVGGAVLWFWHERAWEWVLVALVSLAFVRAARSFRRSSYAVLGAAGLVAAATSFSEKWFSLSLLSLVGLRPTEADEWGAPLVYLVLAAALVVLGLLVGRRRGGAASPPA